MLYLLMSLTALLVAGLFAWSWHREAQRQGVRIGIVLWPVLTVMLVVGSGLYLWRGMHPETERWLADWNEYRDFANQVVEGTPDPELAAQVPLQSLARVLQRQLLLTPSAEGWYVLALVYSELEAPLVAVTAARRAVAISNGDLEPRLLLARSLIESQQGRLDEESTALLEGVLAQRPDHDGALTLLASAAMQSRDYARALPAWRALLARHGDGDARPLLERMISSAERQAEAQQYFGRILVTVEAPASVSAGGTLFVFLRRPGDSGQPLAAVRVLADRFPLEVVVEPQHWLQEMPFAGTELQAGARYSSTGIGGIEQAELVAPLQPLMRPAAVLTARIQLAESGNQIGK